MILEIKCTNILKQGVALTGRNNTGPPWSVSRPPARQQRYRRLTTDEHCTEQINFSIYAYDRKRTSTQWRRVLFAEVVIAACWLPLPLSVADEEFLLG